MGNLTLEEIGNRIIDAILEERVINRESLNKTIRPILKIWLKCADGFRTSKAPKDKLQWTIEQRDVEKVFWLNKFRKIIGEENMGPYYDELREERKRAGYDVYKEMQEKLTKTQYGA